MFPQITNSVARSSFLLEYDAQGQGELLNAKLADRLQFVGLVDGFLADLCGNRARLLSPGFDFRGRLVQVDLLLPIVDGVKRGWRHSLGGRLLWSVQMYRAPHLFGRVSSPALSLIVLLFAIQFSLGGSGVEALRAAKRAR